MANVEITATVRISDPQHVLDLIKTGIALIKALPQDLEANEPVMSAIEAFAMSVGNATSALSDEK
jgi:hypothetical protein